MEKSSIIFGADKSSSDHIKNKNKYILIPGERPTQRLDNTNYLINFTQLRKRFVLSLHYNGMQQLLIC